MATLWGESVVSIEIHNQIHKIRKVLNEIEFAENPTKEELENLRLELESAMARMHTIDRLLIYLITEKIKESEIL